MIIREALAQGSADLKFAEIKTPNLDASLLLAHVLKKSRTELIAAGTDKIPEKACAAFCELIERRAGGECIAYITGKKEFRGLEFNVNPSVLVPRPDTETLVETALQTADSYKSNLNVLDLCTGSGAVAVSLKNECPELNITATDISAEALEIAKANAARLLAENNIQFYKGDLFDALVNSSVQNQYHMFHIIVSNPPYIPSDEISTLSEEVQNEPRLALDGGACGLLVIKRIIDKAPDYLHKGGTLLLEADPSQMDEITLLLKKRGFTNAQVYNDLSGLQRVIGAIYEN